MGKKVRNLEERVIVAEKSILELREELLKEVRKREEAMLQVGEAAGGTVGAREYSAVVSRCSSFADFFY